MKPILFKRNFKPPARKVRNSGDVTGICLLIPDRVPRELEKTKLEQLGIVIV